MTALALPDAPGWASATPEYVDFSGDLTPFLGGPVTRVHRLGSRFRLAVALPPVRDEPHARRWWRALIAARQPDATVTYPWPQSGLIIGAPGAPTIATAAAGGTSLALTGLTPNYAIRAGQFLSVTHGGRRYLHQAAAQAVASGTGTATVTVQPMLRTAVSVGDAVELGRPLIEGLLEAAPSIGLTVESFARGLSFTITEAE